MTIGRYGCRAEWKELHTSALQAHIVPRVKTNGDIHAGVVQWHRLPRADLKVPGSPPLSASCLPPLNKVVYSDISPLPEKPMA